MKKLTATFALTFAIWLFGGAPDGQVPAVRPAVASAATPEEAPTPAVGPSKKTIRIAFAGDTMTEGASRRVLRDGLGGAGRVLRRADVAVVNLEAAIAGSRSGLARQPKAFNFLAPPRLLDVLTRSGVDAVSLANNHGMDFGRRGLRRTLRARSASRPRMIGIGGNLASALRPYRVEVEGRGVAVFAGSDVLDAGFDWAATGSRSGLAVIKSAGQLRAMRSAIRRDRRAHPKDVIAVVLHAGMELVRCPTARQRYLASVLSAAGANAVVMSHAHIMQPSRMLGRTAVDYGLGNFVFYASGAPTNVTGIMVMTFPPGNRRPTMRLRPARIVNGIPVMLRGGAARRASAAYARLGRGC